MPLPFKIFDLTHTLTPDIPTWGGDCGFKHTLKVDYSDSPTVVKFRAQALALNAGIGTHIDAPAHCIPSGKCISDLSLNDLITSCIVIDISDRAHERYSLAPEDIEIFESKYGTIPNNAFVITRTGWDKFWNDPIKYRNNFSFPSISKEAAELLLSRNVAGLGIDTLSPDRPTENFVVHQIILGAGKYLVENIANASLLPPIGAYSFTLPMKAKDLTESPIRLVAIKLD